MTSDSSSWDARRRATEEAFFEKANQEALARLRKREGSQSKPRLSPITGKPMEQLTIMGVVIDRCPESGGIWLDAGELEQIVEASKGNALNVSESTGDPVSTGSSWLDSFFGALKRK